MNLALPHTALERLLLGLLLTLRNGGKKKKKDAGLEGGMIG